MKRCKTGGKATPNCSSDNSIYIYNRSRNDHASSDYYSICPSKQSSVVYLVDACRFTIKHNWDIVRNAAGTAECSCLALRLRSREPRC